MNQIERFFALPDTSCFIFGPRGSGKSTWLEEKFPHALRIDLLKPEILRLYSAYPENLRDVVLASLEKTIIIDEVQKEPKLLDVVHELIEKKMGFRFILTGSSARKLKRAGVNLLAGRALIYKLHPFMAAELGNSFDLEQALQFGLIPLVITSNNVANTLRTYIDLYLQEEVKTEGLVRNIGDFSRFLEVMSFSHASIINLTNIARECLVSRKIAESYLSILQDLLLCHLLPVFTKRAKRTVISHPKFYYFDAGVFHSLRTYGPLDTHDELSGLTLEGLVMQHLVAWNDYQDAPNKLFYWHTKYGVEVDFIVYGPDCFWALEVKNKKNIFSKDVSSLVAFSEEYPEANLLLVYRGTERLKIKNVLCLPVTDFLLNLTPKNKQLI